jgi:hypothetical protein
MTYICPTKFSGVGFCPTKFKLCPTKTSQIFICSPGLKNTTKTPTYLPYRENSVVIEILLACTTSFRWCMAAVGLYL